MDLNVSTERLLEGSYGLVVAAPSVRSPAYEKQMDLLQEEVHRLGENGVVLILLLDKGQSMIGGDQLDDASADRLLKDLGATCDRFCIVLLDPAGKELYRTDAPIPATVIYNHLEQVA